MRAASHRSVTFALFPFEALPPALFSFAFNLVKSNMHSLYSSAADTGWSDKRKRKEMRDPHGRYLFAFWSDKAGPDAPVISYTEYHPQLSGIPIGFLYFVFCLESSFDDADGGMHGDGEAPVVYCMELQIIPEAQNSGLGETMMRIHEAIGKKLGLRKSMLTVFKANERAIRFYTRLGYSCDRISPSIALTEQEAKDYSYEILKIDL
ncbi:hypothetical protein HDU82_005755 [Entophlyctis luteolus]|nr:hypothetical protein HDU82_005755 [Entophlyctis luteolus]